jgi:hypothetical protein
VFLAILLSAVLTGQSAGTSAGTQAAVRQAFLKHTSMCRNLLHFSRTDVVFPWAVQHWGTFNFGGEALLRYERRHGWNVVASGGGALDVASLRGLGVPQSVAEQLTAKSSVRPTAAQVAAGEAQTAQLQGAIKRWGEALRRGDAAVKQSDFRTAIVYFKQVALLNPNTDQRRLGYDGARIQAAKDARAALEAGTVSPSQAPAWFQNQFDSVARSASRAHCR